MRTNFYASLLAISAAASSLLVGCDWSTSDIRKPYESLDGRWLLPGSDHSCDDITRPFLLIEGDEWSLLFQSRFKFLAWKDVKYEFSDGKVTAHASVKNDLRSAESDFSSRSFEYSDNGDTMEMVRIFSGEVSFDMEDISKIIGSHHFEKLSICESNV